jgi:hypothetical protein
VKPVVDRFPLSWPLGWPRTPVGRRTRAKFGSGEALSRRSLTLAQALERLEYLASEYWGVAP